MRLGNEHPVLRRGCTPGRATPTDASASDSGERLSYAGHRVGVLGAAFKPGSDDVRNSASLNVCGRLAAEGAVVTVHDPVALRSAALVRPDLRYAESALAAAASADLLLHLTGWEEYRLVDPHVLGAVVARRHVIDARSALDEQRWRSAGWSFHALGRP